MEQSRDVDAVMIWSRCSDDLSMWGKHGGACASSPRVSFFIYFQSLHFTYNNKLVTDLLYPAQPSHNSQLLARPQQNQYIRSTTPPIWTSQPRPRSQTSTPKTHYRRKRQDGTVCSRPSKTHTASPQTSSAEVPAE